MCLQLGRVGYGDRAISTMSVPHACLIRSRPTVTPSADLYHGTGTRNPCRKCHRCWSASPTQPSTCYAAISRLLGSTRSTPQLHHSHGSLVLLSFDLRKSVVLHTAINAQQTSLVDQSSACMRQDYFFSVCTHRMSTLPFIQANCTNKECQSNSNRHQHIHYLGSRHHVDSEEAKSQNVGLLGHEVRRVFWSAALDVGLV